MSDAFQDDVTHPVEMERGLRFVTGRDRFTGRGRNDQALDPLLSGVGIVQLQLRGSTEFMEEAEESFEI